MKSFIVVTLVLLPISSYAWNLLRTESQTPVTVNDSNEYAELLPAKFNPAELLDSGSRKTDIYTKAMLELKRLEEEPICHRMAAQLLMANCQGLENISDKAEEYDAASFSIQRHHVESFAASLALCDMERARFDISDSCTPLRSSALHIAIRGTGKLHVSRDQVSWCLEALAQNHSHWMTWLSYRDKALLFCRGARVDIDKDQSIRLHKELNRIMAEFTSALYDDLRNMSEKLADQGRAVDSFYEMAMDQAENWKAKVHETFEGISDEAKDVKFAMKSIVNSSNDIYRTLKNLVSTMVQTNAEMAAEHENNVAVTVHNAQARMKDIDSVVGETGVSLGVMKNSMEQIFTMINALGERQAALEESSQVALSLILNTTELMQGHTQFLAKASTAASGIHQNLEKAAANAITLNSGVPFLNWGTRVVAPFAAVILGSYGIPPSFTSNILLFITGSAVAEAGIRSQGCNRGLCWTFWNCPRVLETTEPDSQAHAEMKA